MQKRMSFIVVAVALLVSVAAGSASAYDSVQPGMDIEDYAYMDVDSAPAYLRETILTARYDIVYNTSWTVDGQARLLLPDGTTEALQEYSDLFPDWDLAEVQSVRKAELSAFEDVTVAALPYFNGSVWLQYPGPTNSPVFYVLMEGNTEHRISARATNIPGDHYNIAVASNGWDIVNVPRLSAGVGISLITTPFYSYLFRASSYSSSGYAKITVEPVML